MADAEAPTTAAASPIKKDRSPSFPFITLTKAVERTAALFEQAKRHEMRQADAATAMGYGTKSSGVIQTLAALIAFGLAEDSGSGDARKFRVSDLGFKVLADQRPGARETALAVAATKPKLIAEYAETWCGGRPSDPICISELHIDRGFSEDGAKTFLRVFDDAMGYAKRGSNDKKVDTSDVVDVDQNPPVEFAVGDLVQVTVGGVDALPPSLVRAVQEHGGQKWVFVEGSETGVLMSDVTLVEKAPPPLLTPPTLPQTNRGEVVGSGEELDRFTVDEGVVKIVFPTGMTTDSVLELEQFFQLFIKKAKRRAGTTK